MGWSIITTLLKDISIIAIILAMLYFLGKKWLGSRIEESVKHEYAKKLAEHEVQLQTDVDRKVTDKALFAKFMETLPSSGSIEFLKTFDMGWGSFETEQLAQLKDFYYNWNKPECEFLDSDLENKRIELRNVVQKYITSYGINTFLTDDIDQKRAYVLPEWKIRQPERYRQAVEELNFLAIDVVKAHEDLVRSARKRLNY